MVAVLCEKNIDTPRKLPNTERFCPGDSSDLYLVYLVYLVYMVYLVLLVYLVYLVYLVHDVQVHYSDAAQAVVLALGAPSLVKGTTFLVADGCPMTRSPQVLHPRGFHLVCLGKPFLRQPCCTPYTGIYNPKCSYFPISCIITC